MATNYSEFLVPFTGATNNPQGRFMMGFPSYSGSHNWYNSGFGAIGKINNTDIVYIPNGANASYDPCYSSSNRLIWNSSNYSDLLNKFPLGYQSIIPDSSTMPATDNVLVFPTTYNSTTYTYSVILNKPYFIDSSFTCSNLSYISAYGVYSYEVEDSSGGSGGSINLNSDDLVNAILFIPATLIVLSFFAVVYRMFINRRTRA